MKKHHRIIIITALTALAALLLVIFFIWRRGPFLPDYISWNTRTESIDINGDGSEESIGLSGKKLKVLSENEVLFSSEEGWMVSDFLTADIDYSGDTELLLLVWKQGNYGTSRPFWVDEDEDNDVWSQHLFVYRWEDDRIKPVWMSSDLGLDAKDWSVDDKMLLHMISDDGSETIWAWNEFGFALIEDPDSYVSPADSTSSVSVSLIAAGDNIAHKGIYSGVRDGDEYDFSPVYENIKDVISGADIAAVNQETVFIKDNSDISDYPDFGTPMSMGDALVDAGFDIITCATNHIMDKGDTAILDTLAYWSGSHPETEILGIRKKADYSGEPDIIDVKGIRLALFNYTFGLNGHYPSESSDVTIDLLENEDILRSCLQNAESQADMSVCFLHFGEEYSREPSDEQAALCERLIDAGADLIIGTHPHVLQPFGEITTPSGNKGVVFYSLGNFAANQPFYETILGGLASVTITKTYENGQYETMISSYELIPTVCHYSKGYTRVFLLDDYTDDLAADHYICREVKKFAVEDLWRMFESL